MDKQALFEILQAVKEGRMETSTACAQIARLPFEITEAGRLDLHRAIRQGFPEVIFGQGKTAPQVALLFSRLALAHSVVLCTRASHEQAEAVILHHPDAIYDPEARVLYRAPSEIPLQGQGRLLIVAAGTADLPVAKEAFHTARLMGNPTDLLFDVGVAGLHRLLAELPRLRQAHVLIVVAGMEGALPSVVAGLCDRPVIAVPTSVGYGTGAGGYAALLSMLNSCAAGITVVNIDNGFGAAYAASLINRAPASPPPSERRAEEEGGFAPHTPDKGFQTP